jgi:SAM-dependent methyltransferase/DNA-binding transcriptional ArsR family regulator
MSENLSVETDRASMFKALGEPTRIRIFDFLRSCCCQVAVEDSGAVRTVDGPTVGEVCCQITGADRINSTISEHLKELREAGLISIERRGRNMICGVKKEVIESLSKYLGEGSNRTMTEQINLVDRADVRNLVREKYGAAALTVLNGEGAACCGGNAGGGDTCSGGDAITGGLYSNVEASEIPEAALLASLGCGNPTALAALNPGEIVLDLGSGGGIDVLLSARRVGPTGFAYGLDMTDEMLALAEKNKASAGATNVVFLRGHIESIPLPASAVDVVISNCVINLSTDKDAVLREAFRVLKPGGRFAVSDVVVEGELPAAVRSDLEALVGCVAGALEKDDYLDRLKRAGFVDVSIEPTRRYTFADLEATTCTSAEVAALSVEERAALDGRVMGAFIRAVKPKSGSCCGPECCA